MPTICPVSVRSEYHNVIVDCAGGWGIQLYSESSWCWIYNNTIARNDGGIVHGNEAGHVNGNNRIERNIIVDSRKLGGVCDWWGGMPSPDNFLTNNIIYGNRPADVNVNGNVWTQRVNASLDPRLDASLRPTNPDCFGYGAR